MAFLTENLLWFALIPVGFALFAVVRYYFPNVKDDGPVEQAIEKVIEEKTGISVDLSPELPKTQV